MGDALLSQKLQFKMQLMLDSSIKVIKSPFYSTLTSQWNMCTDRQMEVRSVLAVGEKFFIENSISRKYLILDRYKR